MNDPVSELAFQTIETIRRDGWTTGIMGGQREGRHCLLGSIGKARWGDQWDMDCQSELENVYEKLKTDAAARGLVQRLVNVIAKRSELRKRQAIEMAHTPHSKWLAARVEQQIVYGWNDQEAASVRSVISVLKEAAKGEL
jgi:hypothetical protein